MLKILYYNADTIIRNLAESLVISGFPMSTTVYTKENLEAEIHKLYQHLSSIYEGDGTYNDLEAVDKYLKRGEKLGHSPIGEGHNCAFKGVQFNVIINAPLYWMKQYQRYHFTDIISSQSTMHRITKMDIERVCNEYVDNRIIMILNNLVDEYNATTNVQEKEVIFNKIIANCPSGLTLTQGITLNYLQLISMYKQRNNHKLEEWSEDFISFCNELPFFNRLTGQEVLPKSRRI